LKYLVVEADSGAMGGSQSHEFMVASDAGEDLVVRCAACGYAANQEKAVSVAVTGETPDDDDPAAPEEIHTPGQKTIAEVAAFLKTPETRLIKSVVVVADG